VRGVNREWPLLRFPLRGARPDAGPEEVEEDAQDGEGRDGQDHAGQPGQLIVADHVQEYVDVGCR
jgi:hypothetical protein